MLKYTNEAAHQKQSKGSLLCKLSNLLIYSKGKEKDQKAFDIQIANNEGFEALEAAERIDLMRKVLRKE